MRKSIILSAYLFTTAQKFDRLTEALHDTDRVCTTVVQPGVLPVKLLVRKFHCPPVGDRLP